VTSDIWKFGFAADGFTVRFNQHNRRDEYVVIQLVESMLATREYRNENH